ncbi:hypothetical protein RM192_05540 [Novosphingobium sp. MMS21-SN21R]|nr:hypothetical protein [Novosphingobium sp. MMS21-SN21R]MDT0507452.1 hypothetical protein [Novosphingobium sp. MMS21-SN21R]
MLVGQSVVSWHCLFLGLLGGWIIAQHDLRAQTLCCLLCVGEGDFAIGANLVLTLTVVLVKVAQGVRLAAAGANLKDEAGGSGVPVIGPLFASRTGGSEAGQVVELNLRHSHIP